jgi:hypothetical protein
LFHSILNLPAPQQSIGGKCFSSLHVLGFFTFVINQEVGVTKLTLTRILHLNAYLVP